MVECELCEKSEAGQLTRKAAAGGARGVFIAGRGSAGLPKINSQLNSPNSSEPPNKNSRLICLLALVAGRFSFAFDHYISGRLLPAVLCSASAGQVRFPLTFFLPVPSAARSPAHFCAPVGESEIRSSTALADVLPRGYSWFYAFHGWRAAMRLLRVGA